MKPIILFIVAVFLPGKSDEAFPKRNTSSENPMKRFQKEMPYRKIRKGISEKKCLTGKSERAFQERNALPENPGCTSLWQAVAHCCRGGIRVAPPVQPPAKTGKDSHADTAWFRACDSGCGSHNAPENAYGRQRCYRPLTVASRHLRVPNLSRERMTGNHCS